MPLRILLAAALAAALLGAAGCGAPDKLDGDDDRALATAREGLDDALDTEERIRTSPSMGRRLAARVERAGDDPRAVRRLVPSLVDDGQVDSEAASAFVRYAATDAPRALLIPATREVDRMLEVIDDSGADGDTDVPHARDQPMSRFLDEVERDIRDIWPSLSKNLEQSV
jgi:hypothetical protein